VGTFSRHSVVLLVYDQHKCSDDSLSVKQFVTRNNKYDINFRWQPTHD